MVFVGEEEVVVFFFVQRSKMEKIPPCFLLSSIYMAREEILSVLQRPSFLFSEDVGGSGVV